MYGKKKEIMRMPDIIPKKKSIRIVNQVKGVSANYSNLHSRIRIINPNIFRPTNSDIYKKNGAKYLVCIKKIIVKCKFFKISNIIFVESFEFLLCSHFEYDYIHSKTIISLQSLLHFVPPNLSTHLFQNANS